LCCTGCVDASGNVEYFNVSKALVEKGESITFKCGGTRERGQDGEVLSLTLHIRKWFNGSSEKWLLAVNEQVEVANDFERYNAVLHQKEQIREVEFTILGKKSTIFCVRKCCHSEIYSYRQELQRGYK